MYPWDIQYLINNSLVPVSPTAPKSWSAGPGMTDTLVRNFGDALGKPNLIRTRPFQKWPASVLLDFVKTGAAARKRRR
jgi:hypothetical protein